jgi:hypothetical protein
LFDNLYFFLAVVVASAALETVDMGAALNYGLGLSFFFKFAFNTFCINLV